jgi:hypothetical protein
MSMLQIVLVFIGLILMGVGSYHAGRKTAECRMNHTLSVMFISVLDYYESKPDLSKSAFLKYGERIVLSCAHDIVRSWARQRMVGHSNSFVEATYGKPEAPSS